MSHSEQIDKLAAALAAPFPPERISWRVGSTTADKKRGMALAFIDARDVMQRLDEVCGVDGWQNRYPHANGKTVCEIGVGIPRIVQDDGGIVAIEWVWKADGAGDTDFEAEKGALSDAFKRAAVRWGIGRYLYDMPAPWVAIEQAGKSYKIVESELPRLRAMLSQARGAGNAAPSLSAAAPQPQAVPRAPIDGNDADWLAWCRAVVGRLKLRGEAKRLMDMPTFLSDLQALNDYNPKYFATLDDKINVSMDNERSAA